MFNLIVGINILQRARASLVEENMAAHYYNTEHVHPYSWDQVCLTIVHCFLLKYGFHIDALEANVTMSFMKNISTKNIREYVRFQRAPRSSKPHNSN